MSRRGIHLCFGLITLGLAIAATVQWRSITEHQAIRDAVNQIQAASTADTLPSTQPRHPEVKLAWATALSAHGRHEAAEITFNELIQQKRSPAIARAAQFNLANSYLRRGMGDDLVSERKRALLEFAKQRYRDLLRDVPDDWNARYNLQIALRLAPEDGDIGTRDKGKPIKQVDVIVPGFAIEDLP